MNQRIIIESFVKIVFNSIAKSSKAVLESAESEFKKGDEEKAYIFYMKYFKLINLLQKSKTYKKDKEEIRIILGNTETLHACMNQLESIKVSLLNR